MATNDWQPYKKMPPMDTQIDLLVDEDVIISNAVQRGPMAKLFDVDGNEIVNMIFGWRYSVED